ncbi:hypothetical protein [Flavobacterium salmonis]|uniref:Tox-MPTase2 domain-containing protein n=1 Tax=Flavobacterium salmonis TaxID=2654844 RepID=A0A6V6ZC20_9FLAO|nr:hypothetical protein [Flavobacterium salmonis]CAD0009328.1 hypothetical protein FLAT13_04849 [Flavobacterium salmonis]
MQKTIYICLMTLFFSLSAFAYGYDEYGGNSGWNSASFGSPVNNTGGMTAGGNFWSTNVSSMIDRNGAVTNNFDYYSPRYYVGSGGNTQQQDDTNWQTAPSIMDYEQRAGDVINMYWLHETTNPSSPLVLDANGNAQFGFIITNGGSIMQPTNEYTGYTPAQINNAIMGIGNYDPNPPVKPYFSYNNYNSTNNTNTVTVYEATPTGPVVVDSKVIVTYNDIPRVGILGFTAQPPPEFYAAGQLLNKTTLTLSETHQFIENYIDRIFADVDGPTGRVAQIKNAIAKYANSLSDEQKPYAEEIVIADKYSLVIDGSPLASNPFVDGKNYVFDSNGYPKAAGADGKLIQIEIDGVKKLPSELDANNTSQRMILTRIAIFLAQKINAPVGSHFATGKHPKPNQLSSNVPAFTSPIAPYLIVLNMRGGKYSEDLDNIYSFTHIVVHELGHQYNKKHDIESNVKTHIDVYIDAMETTSFKLSPPEFKLSIVKSLANYIWNMDKKPGYYLSEIQDRIIRFNSNAIHNGGYKIEAPKDPENLGHILFKKGELNNNNLKVYNPETGQNENFTINFLADEK